VRNRLTAGGLFLFPPQIDWLPPLSTASWWEAYQLHQQDPAFAACGASESIEEFQVLYGREWLRQTCGLLLAATAAIGLLCAALLPRFRFALPRLIVFGLIGLAYAAAAALMAFAVGHVEALSRFNTGQYRHAVDLVFATAAVACVLVSAVRPPLPQRRRRDGRSSAAWLWGGAVLLAVLTGALFAARDATGVWTTWPGYEGSAFPPADRLTSFTPLWLNLTANQYTIQLAHRMVAAALWLASLVWLVVALVRGAGLGNAAALFGLVSAESAVGIFTLMTGAPALPSILHQVGAIVLLAGAILAARRRGAAPVRAIVGAPIIGYESF
jgi:cytochrome c oxidase assembly protein subunit 15